MCLYVFVYIQLSVGAVQSLGSQKPVDSTRNFYGCLENLLYNGRNLIELVKHKDHQVSVMVSRLSQAQPAALRRGGLHIDLSSDILWSLNSAEKCGNKVWKYESVSQHQIK